MNAARDVSPCQRFDGWLSAYVDNELDAIHTLEVEDHLKQCPPCNEQTALLRAARCSLKRTLSCRCPSALRTRIARVLVDAHPTQAGSLGEGQSPASTSVPVATATSGRSAQLWGSSVALFRLRHIMPLAAAATVLLVFGVMQLQHQQDASTAVEARSYQRNKVATLDRLLEEMVAQHANPLPPETTDPNGLAKFDRYLGLHVRRPKFDAKQVHYLGARMMPRHAMLQYMLRNKRRVSLYVFDAKRVPLRGQRLHPRHMGARNVYVGNLRGYSIAASERNGIGYVLTSDLPDEENAKMVLAAAR